MQKYSKYSLNFFSTYDMLYGARDNTMTVLQVGQAKSGNYFLYKIIQRILQEAKFPIKTFIEKDPINKIASKWELSNNDQALIDVIDFEPLKCFYRIGPIYRMPIEDLESYVKETNHVWTHSRIDKSNAQHFKHFDKIIYIVRDPRDIAISMSHFAFTPYMQKYCPTRAPNPDTYLNNNLDRQILTWINHVGNCLKYKNEFSIHFILYERLISSFQEELTELLKFLEIDLNEETKMKIENEVSYQTMKKQSPNHVRKGQVRQWSDILSSNQIKYVNRIAKPMLTLLNYPTGKNMNDLPHISGKLNLGEIDKAMKSANTKIRLQRFSKLLYNRVKKS